METVSEEDDPDDGEEPPELSVDDPSSSESETDCDESGLHKSTHRSPHRATKTTGKNPNPPSTDGDCPHHLAEHVCPNSSSSAEADSDSNAVMGRPSFNSKSKTATGIENLSKTCAIPHVKKKHYKNMKGYLPGDSIKTIKWTF